MSSFTFIYLYNILTINDFNYIFWILHHTVMYIVHYTAHITSNSASKIKKNINSNHINSSNNNNNNHAKNEVKLEIISTVIFFIKKIKEALEFHNFTFMFPLTISYAFYL